MKKIWSTGVILSFLLSSAFLSCQKESNNKLKVCSKACQSEFEIRVGMCDKNKDQMEAANCKIKEMTDYNTCVQKCNTGFMNENMK